MEQAKFDKFIKDTLIYLVRNSDDIVIEYREMMEHCMFERKATEMYANHSDTMHLIELSDVFLSFQVEVFACKDNGYLDDDVTMTTKVYEVELSWLNYNFKVTDANIISEINGKIIVE
ncbi:MAG: hypothetical protein WBN16_11470 [Lutimonas sp.]